MERKVTNNYISMSNNTVINCDLCFSTFGQKQIAEGFCVNCSSNLCANCCQYHRNIGDTRSHILIQDKDNRPNKKIDVASEREFQTCAIHADIHSDYYCIDCGLFCCSICVKEKHHKCGKIEHTVDITERYNAENTLEILKDLKEELETKRLKLTSGEQKVNKLKDNARDKISHLREEIVRLFDRIQSDFEKGVENLESGGKSKLKSAFMLHDTIESDVEFLIVEIKNAKLEGKYGLQKAVKTTKKELPLLQERMKKLDTDTDFDECYCKISKKADQVLSHLNEIVHVMQGACIRLQHT